MITVTRFALLVVSNSVSQALRSCDEIAPLVQPGEVTNATVVLGSHDHADHIDREAWPGIAAL
jgi:L-ascorbate metabolism protein UlaG (beta-lactamase superfamily)